MKKLMVAAAIAFAAVASQAAAISWSTGTYADTAFAYADVYAVSAANYALAIADLTENAGAKFLSTYAVGAAINSSLNKRGGGSGDVALVKGDEQIALFIFKDGITEGKTYYTTGLVGDSSYIYEPPEPSSKTLEFATADAAFTTSGTIANVPEPTSGLLLLLGVAGLALRRRRA